MRKPSYRTSEFWFTVVSFVFSGLFLLGIIKEPDTKDDLIDTFTHVTESVILLGGQAVVLARYIRKRKEEKIEYERTKQKEQDNIRKELEDYIGVDKNHNKININKAGIGELIQLPHIGPVIANKIVEYREKHGNFTHPIDLMKISGVGEFIYKDIDKYITI